MSIFAAYRSFGITALFFSLICLVLQAYFTYVAVQFYRWIKKCDSLAHRMLP
jgi:hypothetical protein